MGFDLDHLVRMMVHNLLWPDGKKAVLEKKSKMKNTKRSNI